MTLLSGQWSFMNTSRSAYQAIGARPSSRPFFRSFESKATVRTDTPLRQHRARTHHQQQYRHRRRRRHHHHHHRRRHRRRC
ncbi:hypothetical protein PUN28_012990 [Cardiocondyla obscurior]|uniref:Uncharacterized protein n=1 Tax=Cardiocondyla obscurior TaxID=286306 RepID=A0AAW2F7N1_9HYME